MSANDLSARLWRERERLEVLLYRLYVQNLILAQGEARWVGKASADVEFALERNRHLELTRAIEMEAVAEEWGLEPGASLRDLAENAPTEAWREIFTEHLAALQALLDEVFRVRDESQMHVRAALMATQEAIAGIDVTGEYAADGTALRSEQAPRLLDRSL